ncbi:hypothetical protein KALB_5331 [Kutzneria albida DSM 43870]|uniref:Uncharacterized protein n=1 Tax=Kutzneria albida DSM 43870 TaxID=1449976 RepID=W5WC13_9PSEU|nr:hypothetical protein KALB_5331 [Kutzneria albida DSM 43870]
MSLVDDQQPIEQLAAETSDHSLTNRVRARRLWWAGEDPDALGGEHGVEHGGESRVPISQQKLDRVDMLTEVHHQVACRLHSPCAGPVGGDSDQMRAAGAVLDDDQRVDPFQENGVDMDEVRRHDALGLRGKELLPGGTRPARCWVDACGGEDLPDCRGGDAVPETNQFSLDAPVSPLRVLGRHADDEVLDRCRGRWTPWAAPVAVVPFPGDQPPMPGQQGRGRDGKDLPPATAWQ